MKHIEQIMTNTSARRRWREPLAEQTFEPVVVERYDLKAFGTALWNMVYFQGRSRK